MTSLKVKPGLQFALRIVTAYMDELDGNEVGELAAAEAIFERIKGWVDRPDTDEGWSHVSG